MNEKDFLNIKRIEKKEMIKQINIEIDIDLNKIERLKEGINMLNDEKEKIRKFYNMKKP